MSNIELCTSIEELKAYPMQELCSLYSKIVKAHCPKFSDKTAAAKRILPLLEQKRAEAKLTVLPAPKFSVHPLPDGGAVVKIHRERGRPKNTLINRKYHFDFVRFLDIERHLAPQAREIIRALMATNQTVWVEGDLMTGISVKTKQNPWRIFQYYRPKLISYKVVRLENA